jgi:hypothetical protein
VDGGELGAAGDGCPDPKLGDALHHVLACEDGRMVAPKRIRSATLLPSRSEEAAGYRETMPPPV